MLHSRRKAEIEILSTIKMVPQEDNLQPLSDRRPHLEDVSSTLRGSPYHGAMGDFVYDCTNSQVLNYANPFPSADSPNPSISTRLPCSSPIRNPSSGLQKASPVYPSAPPSHAPLLSYLVRKITDFIAQAEARATAMEIDS
jgi:hypothetical protein